MPLSNSALASGEASADSASAKSRVPDSMTTCSGRNLRVAGFGVCSVRISMAAMWRLSPLPARERSERRRSGDDPTGDPEADRKADHRDPPFPGAHRRGAGGKLGAAGDHRLGQLLPAEQAVVEDRKDVQDDQSENDVESERVDGAQLVRSVRADQSVQRPRVDGVLVLSA